MLARLAVLIALAGAAPLVFAQDVPTTPPRGETVRAQILDGLRADVRDVPGLERDVIFQVHKLAVLGDYALVTVTPKAKDGDTIDRYEADRTCDLEIVALLQRSDEAWTVAERDVGPCDDAWPDVFARTPTYPAALLAYWEQMDATY